MAVFQKSAGTLVSGFGGWEERICQGKVVVVGFGGGDLCGKWIGGYFFFFFFFFY